MYIFPSSKFSIERSSFLYISIIQIMKRIQLPILCFNESAFSYFSCLELNDFTPFNPKNFWVRNPRPPSTTYLQYQNYHVICVCVDREGLAIVQKKNHIPPRKIKLYVNNCLESRFLQKGKNHHNPTVSSVKPPPTPPPFFLLVKIFGKLHPL